MKADLWHMPVLARHFYFLRHGETESNLHGTIAGATDVPLTERGRLQARAAATVLENCRITAIYSSPLCRACDTAEYIARSLDLLIVVIPELAERNWGVLEGKPRELRVPGITPPGAETPEEFSRRVLKGFGKINAEGMPLVVAHSGVFRVLCRTLGIAESSDQVSNARPVGLVAPDPEHPTWRLEVL